ncbi:uncharacterized protein SCHCODRAFT_02615143 [Schizophyllum commune H4-8]|nr:uncharacterized protein SCHCODRAFT_02615143 [Schizophyllum commune H4-8]KAI5896540.1 hypothetical protein SCHCODRAFT_02615143 [Schizophyllum commune H4-8]
MGNRFSSIAVGNKVTADRRRGSGPIRTARSSEHRTLPYPKQSPKRAELARRGSSHASSPSSSARLTRFRDDPLDAESSASDIEEGWDSHTTVIRPVNQSSDNAAHDGRNSSAAPPSCVSTLPAPTRDSIAPPRAHRYTAFLHMPIESPPICIPLNLRPIPSLPTHFTSTHTHIHVQVEARTTSLPPPRAHVSRESSPDYELLNPNTQGQAVWEIEEEGSHGVAMTEVSEEGGTSREIPSIQVSACPISHVSGSTIEAGFIPPQFPKPVSSPNPDSVQDKIPKPPGEPGKPNSGGYNLQEAMRLEPGHFCTVRTGMNNLVRTYLDTVRSFTKQTEECVAAYTVEALRSFPLLEDYEDRWPIRDFARMHLHYLQNNARRQEERQALELSRRREIENEGGIVEEQPTL